MDEMGIKREKEFHLESKKAKKKKSKRTRDEFGIKREKGFHLESKKAKKMKSKTTRDELRN